MHEMAIAGAVLDSVIRHAGERRVERVRLRVGHLRQVVPRALTFAWELASQRTVAEGSTLEIAAVPAAVRCRRCAEESEPGGFPLACRLCGGVDVEVVRGEELEIEWLDVESRDEAADEGAAAPVAAQARG